MDLTAYIDLYCERTASGWWNEPLNAASNFAFWVAAWVVWRAGRRYGPLDGEMRVLLGPLLVIGAASFGFHTLATRWAAGLDSAAIALYLHAYLALYLRRVWAWPWRWAWVGVPAFLALSSLAALAWSMAGLGAAGYLGARTVLLLLVADSSLLRGRQVARPLAMAGGVFAVSLSLRQVDLRWCSEWPWGTHFAWHLLNSLTLGLTAWALLQRPPRAQQAQRFGAV